jgi:hypothetical protein
LAEEQDLPVPPETLIAGLLSKNWGERFVARQRLVRLGAEAAPALQLIAQKDDNPLQQTALWLLHNIEQASISLPTASSQAKIL